MKIDAGYESSQPQPHVPVPQLAFRVLASFSNRVCIAIEAGVIDRPPSAVQRSSRGIWLATRLAVRITSSNGTTSMNPASAMFAQQTAFAAAITFFPKHGASTRLAIGSQIKPIMLCSAIEAAATV